jgi:predicted nucleic acid-binding protein
MVLVDTSVWIRFLADREPEAVELDRLLTFNEVIGHELVFGELLIGDRGGRRELLDAYEQLPRASSVAHREIVEFVRHRKLHGRGIGWIDTHLLGSALIERVRLWTADSALTAIAAELGVAYAGPRSRPAPSLMVKSPTRGK